MSLFRAVRVVRQRAHLHDTTRNPKFRSDFLGYWKIPGLLRAALGKLMVRSWQLLGRSGALLVDIGRLLGGSWIARSGS